MKKEVTAEHAIERKILSYYDIQVRYNIDTGTFETFHVQYPETYIDSHESESELMKKTIDDLFYKTKLMLLVTVNKNPNIAKLMGDFLTLEGQEFSDFQLSKSE